MLIFQTMQQPKNGRLLSIMAIRVTYESHHLVGIVIHSLSSKVPSTVHYCIPAGLMPDIPFINVNTIRDLLVCGSIIRFLCWTSQSTQEAALEEKIELYFRVLCSGKSLIHKLFHCTEHICNLISRINISEYLTLYFGVFQSSKMSEHKKSGCLDVKV